MNQACNRAILAWLLHLALLAALTTGALAHAAAVRDFRVQSGGESAVLHYHATDQPGPRPAILLLHGLGGYQAQRAGYDAPVPRLNRQGYDVYILIYYSEQDQRSSAQPSFAARKAWRAQRFPVWLGKVSAALDFIAQQNGTGKTGVLGFSQGAFVAVAAAAGSPRVSALVELYGGIPPQMPSRPGRLPPTLILHGAQDQVVSPKYARELEKLLQQQKVAYRIKMVANVGHGFDMATTMLAEVAQQQFLPFFGQYLKPGMPDRASP